jgi:hypothetical protein
VAWLVVQVTALAQAAAVVQVQSVLLAYLAEIQAMAAMALQHLFLVHR